MLTLRDWRRSRFLTQLEVALLADIHLLTIKRKESEPLSELGREIVAEAELRLNLGPHEFIKPKYFWPDTLDRMTGRQRIGLKVGSCYAVLDYFNDELIKHGACLRRPDLRQLVRANTGERLVTLMQIKRSRWYREKEIFGMQVKDVKVPTLRPLSDFLI